MRRGCPERWVSNGALFFLVVASLWLGSGCASSSRVIPPDPTAEAWLLPPDPAAVETVRVMITEAVDPLHAPVPTNDAERIVFAHLYTGLTELQPDGTVIPVLAERVTPKNDLLWSIRLRSDLRFADGTTLRAIDVARSWLLASQRHPDREVWRQFDPLLVRAQGIHDLLIRTPEPGVDLPRLLADPAFAVVSDRGEDELAIGAGPLYLPAGRIATGENLASPNRYFAGKSPSDPETWDQPQPEETAQKLLSSGTFPVDPVDPGVSREPLGPPLREVTFLFDPAADPRDATASGTHIDAIVVRQREADRFLQAAGFGSHPLPYDRGYVLLVAGPVPLEVDRQELADLTVREFARPWSEVEVAEERTPSPEVEEMLLLRRSDEGSAGPRKSDSGHSEAARIGTRLAAIWDADVVVRMESDPHVRLEPGQAVVVPVARGTGAPNLSSLTLHWLDLETETQIGILSLLEARAHLLTFRGLHAVRVDGRGVPRFEHAGRGPAVSPSPTVVP